jgi:hypothetical protein
LHRQVEQLKALKTQLANEAANDIPPEMKQVWLVSTVLHNSVEFQFCSRTETQAHTVTPKRNRSIKLLMPEFFFTRQKYDLVRSVGEECVTDAELLNLVLKKPGMYVKRVHQIFDQCACAVFCPQEA